jgi:hypothetical protein
MKQLSNVLLGLLDDDKVYRCEHRLLWKLDKLDTSSSLIVGGTKPEGCIT